MARASKQIVPKNFIDIFGIILALKTEYRVFCELIQVGSRNFYIESQILVETQTHPRASTTISDLFPRIKLVPKISEY